MYLSGALLEKTICSTAIESVGVKRESRKQNRCSRVLGKAGRFAKMAACVYC